MHSILRATALLLLAMITTAARADTPFPDRAIRIVAPSGPGLLDLVARMTADKLAKALSATVIVENRTGAGGNIGAETVARSTPDGYTLLLADGGILTLNDRLYPSLGYNAETAFAPISMIAEAPMILVVPSDSPFSTVAEVITAARAEPRKLFYGSAGKGTGGHVAMQLFQNISGTAFTHVAYKGSSEAATAVATSQVNVLFNNLPTLRPFLQAGKVRALGVASDRRLASLPNVPTLIESGLPRMTASAWFGLVAPAGTPPDIVKKFEKAVVQGMAEPDVKTRFNDAGIGLVASPTSEFQSTIASERQRMARLAKEGAFSSE